jgi:tetratricopeptide (TPR) repeat protein
VLSSGHARWQAVWTDATAVVLVPPGAGSWPSADAQPQDAPEQLAHRAARSRATGDLDEAERLAQRAVERDPLFVPAWAELMAIHAARQDAAAIERTLDTARRGYPQHAAELEAYAAAAYRAAGDVERSMLALRRSRHTGPF